MAWLCRDSQISVNTEKVKIPQQQELCVTEHSWLVWWLLALIALCRVFGTCWTHLPRKSLALPKNSGRKKALPYYGCLVFNTDTVDSRGISCSSDSMGSTQGLTALARCVMPPPSTACSSAWLWRCRHLAAHLVGVTWCLSTSRKKCRVYI